MRAIASLSLIFALLGCDSQVGVAYRGEPLLSMTGRVELAEERPDGPLVPALAFLDEERGFVYFLDVEVTGEFPAEFSIDVFDPPPDDAFVPVSKFLDGPLAAVGYITAVVEDHPASVRLGNHQGGLATCDAEQCRSEESWCTVDLSECYVEVGHCAPDDLTDCVIEGSGDPALKEDAFEKFAGFSENYRVVYLKEAVPPDSYVARLTGSLEGLAAGYHLFELGPSTEAELAEHEVCWAEAAAAATEEYNGEHDSSFAPEDFQGGGVGCAGMAPVAACPPGEPCEQPEPEPIECPPSPDEDALFEFGRAFELAKLELGCQLAEGHIERVEDPANEPIAVRIGMDAVEVSPRVDRAPTPDP
jgi:hypothetical protein